MHVVAYVMTFRTFQNEFKFITPANNLFLMIHACSSFQWELTWSEDKKAVYQRFTKLIRHVACQERCSRKKEHPNSSRRGIGLPYEIVWDARLHT